MNILYTHADSPQEWNCSHWRAIIPALGINETTEHRAQVLDLQNFAFGTPLAQALCAWADTIVIQRNLFLNTHPAIQYWRSKGKLMLADLDDAYHLVEPGNLSYGFWHDAQGIGPDNKPVTIQPHPLAQLTAGLQLCHGYIAPNALLAEDYKAYAPGYYLPNYLEWDRWQSFTAKPHEGLVIGWGGSLSHRQSWANSGIISALKQVLQVWPQVKLQIHTSDKVLVDSLDFPPDRLIHKPWVSYADWPGAIAEWDIGVIPLAGEYDKRRSFIKPLELCAADIPWIASDNVEYRHLQDHGRIVGADGWYTALDEMLKKITWHKTQMRNYARPLARSLSIEQKAHHLVQAYQRIRKEQNGK